MSNNAGRSGRLSTRDRREQIVRAAAEHFAREGFDATALEAIAADLGISRALVYHYFPGKTALLAAVVEMEADRVLEATAGPVELSLREQLRAGIEAYLEHVAHASDAMNVFYRPGRGVDPAIEAIVDRNLRMQIDRITSGLGIEDPSPLLMLALQGWCALVIECSSGWASSESIEKQQVRDLLFETCVACIESAGYTVPTD
ncbi:TetR/AcrR family transcriptional regulator [Nocardia abscessus]|uniref:TetR/AcrR family transcriptional regulator n=1 Tax=Nocardia TaxID=1817 RepID=UPI0018936E98|nr:MULTISPECIES: TetR/AcrR family transcriptional regulator [Nocardia]MBF6222617.1 TetR/AcrR family transcriptional regulator [Nocardia abscessus]MDE1672989.1 TetR/AcrR family transcriptional regulator [Nocardia gipuzkoensis]